MIGYACINEALQPEKFMTCRLQSVRTNGIDYLRSRALHNVAFLEKILHWNESKGIGMYRILSDMIPLVTHPEILSNYSWRWYEDEEILAVLGRIKAYAAENGMRLSMHPDQYTVINSINENTVAASVAYLGYHADFLEAVGGSDLILSEKFFGWKTMTTPIPYTMY